MGDFWKDASPIMGDVMFKAMGTVPIASPFSILHKL